MAWYSPTTPTASSNPAAASRPFNTVEALTAPR